jgi:hypothetical protein
VPTLEEMRKWLQGERVEELPDREPSPSTVELDETIHRQLQEWSEGEVVKTLEEAEGRLKLAPPEPPPAAWYPDKTVGVVVLDWIEREKYSIKVDGTDVRIRFGSWNGDLVSEMASFPEGMNYLQWMLKEGGFIRPADKDMMRVIKAYAFPLSPEAEEMEARKRVALAFGPAPGTVSKSTRKRSREEEPRIKERKERVRSKIKKARPPRAETREIKTIVKADGTIVDVAKTAEEVKKAVAEEVRKAHAEGLVHPSEVVEMCSCGKPAKYYHIGGGVSCGSAFCEHKARY